MAIVRNQTPARDYTVSANGWLRDPNLSGKAKGYLSYIASHAANYDLTFEQMVAEMAEGPAAVRAGLVELETKGYLRRPRRRNPDGTLGGYDWHVIDFPGSKTAGNDQVAKIESGSEQGEDDVFAGDDQTRKSQPGSEQGKHDVSAGQNHTRKPQAGSDLQEQDVSAGRNQTRKSNPKKTKNPKEETQEKIMERSEVECLPSGRFAPFGPGDEDEDPPSLILKAPTTKTKGFTDWHAEDYDLLVAVVGSDHVISDGTVSQADTYSTRVLYDALLKFPGKPKEWPGRFLAAVAENHPDGTAASWLARFGLEAA